MAIFCASFTGLALAGGSFVVRDGGLPEISGLATSLRVPGLYWAHNDSGNSPALLAIDGEGRVQRRVRLANVVNVDWEDLAAFRWHGAPYLLLADTGDNFAVRAQVALLLLPEPSASGPMAVTRTLYFSYPGGPCDVEAVAVDADAGQIMLLEKRRPPARLFALALDGPDRQQARVIASLPDWWPEPQSPVETIGDRRYRGAATAMDLSPDRRHLAILTNTHWAVFARAPGADWNEVFARPPQASGRLPRQGSSRNTIFEALAWADDRHLLISGERLPAPLLLIAPALGGR